MAVGVGDLDEARPLGAHVDEPDGLGVEVAAAAPAAAVTGVRLRPAPAPPASAARDAHARHGDDRAPAGLDRLAVGQARAAQEPDEVVQARRP